VLDGRFYSKTLIEWPPAPLSPYEVILCIGVLHDLSLSAEYLFIQLANVTKSILSEKAAR
jgi:hypothetical protein